MADIILENEALKSGKLRYKHLIGKPFSMGHNDCYSMLRNMYKDNLDIELTNYARPNDWWLEEGQNLYVDRYKQEGFFLLEEPDLADLQPLDVMLIAIPDPRNLSKTVTNHCAIYLGEGTVIHHRLGTLSSIAPYRGVLRNLTTHIIRHKQAPDLKPKYRNTLNSVDFILPHKKELVMEAVNESNFND